MTRQTARPKVSALRHWKTKAATGISVAAATVAVILMLSTATTPVTSVSKSQFPPLKLHSLQAVSAISLDATSAGVSYGPSASPVRLTVSSYLSQVSTPTGVSTVQLIEPSDLVAATLAVAQVFGLEGSVLHTPQGGLAVIDTAMGRVNAGEGGGFLDWGFGSNPADGNCANYPPASATYPATCVPITTGPPATRGGALPTDTAAIAGATAIAHAVDPNLPFGEPVVTDHPTEVDVVIPVMIDGLATDQSVSVAYGPGGSVLNAMGIVASLGSERQYSLTSPVDAAKALATRTNATVPTSSSTMTLGAVVTVFSTQHASDGTAWLIPSYVFTHDGTAGSRQFGTLAIGPQFVQTALQP